MQKFLSKSYIETENIAFKLAQTLSINFNNYFLQHCDMPNNIKNQINCIEAWNSKESKWEKVTNFEKGKNNSDHNIKIIKSATGIKNIKLNYSFGQAFGLYDSDEGYGWSALQ